MDGLVSKAIMMGVSMFPKAQMGTHEKARMLQVHACSGQGPQSQEEVTMPKPLVEISGSGPLPLPSSRSGLPGPLRFLWFSKQKQKQEHFSKQNQEEGEDAPQVSALTLEQTGVSQAEDVGLANGKLEIPKIDNQEDTRQSWVHNFWKFRKGSAGQRNGTDSYLCEECEEKMLTPPAGTASDSERGAMGASSSPPPLSSPDAGSECGECCVADAEGDSSSAWEVPHVQVHHTKETFTEFLSQVPLSELKSISRLAHLSKLAYTIPSIKTQELYHLKFVTSSIHQKAEALAKDTASLNEDKQGEVIESDESEMHERNFINPASAYSLAASAASYLYSQTRHLFPGGTKANGVAYVNSNEESFSEGSFREGCGSKSESDVVSFIASSPVTAMVAAEEGTKRAVGRDLQALDTCPCEWFCCDDKQNKTRYFIIQGSDSLASWQANLLFEPTQFEESSLGVLVHRGIYEAAKGLYVQILPVVLEHLQAHGEKGHIQFTGHSLGGSLGMLLSLMLQLRGIVASHILLPVVTFGSPCIMCGGDQLLRKMGLPWDHVKSVVMHRDIVPRVFACHYPGHVAEVLKRLNGTFRNHPCLNHQKLLYAPMGQYMILQPDQQDAPPHFLLPQGIGLYIVRHPNHAAQGPSSQPSKTDATEVRAALRAFLNSPHPLETLSDRGSYGPEGSVSRDHDPRNYIKSLDNLLRLRSKSIRKLKRQERRQLWLPLIASERPLVLYEHAKEDMVLRKPSTYETLMKSDHIQIVILMFLSAKMLIANGFAAFFAWG